MNKTIWIFWTPTWDAGPEIARDSLSSWQDCNQDWTIRPLDAESAISVFQGDAHDVLKRDDLPAAAYSDILRVELLAKFGGVWVDATTICGNPLDDWLVHTVGSTGYFSFSRPGPDRMIASWFMYAEADSFIITMLRDAVRTYWRDRTEFHNYFWLHGLFEDLYEAHPEFKARWDSQPDVSAQFMFHFGPNNPHMQKPPTQEHLEALKNGDYNVFKLTHKANPTPPEGSLFEILRNHRPPGVVRQ